MLIIVFYFGACMGSFLFWLAHQLVNHSFQLNQRSRCDSCQTTLGILDLTPFVNRVLFKGRCRYCGVKVSIAYFISELATGLLTLFTFWLGNYCPIYFLSIIYLLFLASFCDLIAGWVPDRVQVALLIVILGSLILTNHLSVVHLLGSLMISFVLLSVYLIKPSWLGGADVKTLAILSLGISFKAYSLFLLFSSVLGLLWFVILSLYRGYTVQSIPFIPSLTLAYFFTALLI